jgi:hypothetical protein
LTTVLQQPPNQNFLSSTTFQFFVKKIPNADFFIQRANIPGISIDPVIIGSQLVDVPYSGDHIKYEELNITFRIDEDLSSYLDIYYWIKGLGFSEDSSEYAAIANQSRFSGNGITSEASLIILDAKKRVNFEVTFLDAFPISLSSLQMEYTVDETQYLTADAVFQYSGFDIARIKYGAAALVVNPGG